MDERDKTALDRASLCTGITAARAALKLRKGRGPNEARAPRLISPGLIVLTVVEGFIFPALYYEFSLAGPASVFNFCSTVLSRFNVLFYTSLNKPT